MAGWSSSFKQGFCRRFFRVTARLQCFQDNSSRISNSQAFLPAVCLTAVPDTPLYDSFQRVFPPGSASTSNPLGCSWLLTPPSKCLSYSAAIQSLEKESIGEEDISASATLRKLRDALNIGVAPERGLLSQLLQKSHTSEHIDLALKALQDLRIENAVRRHRFKNFSDEVALELIRACIRAGQGDKGLKALKRENPYGLSPCLATANAILEHAAETANIRLVMNAFRAAIKSGIKPSARMAETVLRACEKNGRLGRFVSVGKEFGVNNVPISQYFHERLLEAAAALGWSRDGLFLAEWRSKQGYPSSVVSAVSTAKLHLIDGQIEEAANQISSVSQEKDKEQLSKALTEMVCDWPQALPKGRSTGLPLLVSYEDLKDRMTKLEELLKSHDIVLPISVGTSFMGHGGISPA